MKLKKVLVIDDEMLMRTTLKILLSNYNIETILVSNGKEGIEAAKNEKPDIILLDLMLPDIDGWNVLDMLRGDKETQNTPVIIFTAMDVSTKKEELKVKGVVSIIRKPFQLKQLVSALGLEKKEGNDG
ncbi:MAG: response regulator [Chitinispirillaceae bacterium]|nr:response regulator [Chitinispirillaceae bacterium]